MAEFVKVATTAELGDTASAKLVEVAGRRVALFQAGGKYYAIEDTCTHAGGPLSEGFLEGNEVTCPWHGACFDVTTGEVKGPPARSQVQSFAVRVVGSDIEVEV